MCERHLTLLIRLGCRACGSFQVQAVPAIDKGDSWGVMDDHLQAWVRAHHLPFAIALQEVKP